MKSFLIGSLPHKNIEDAISYIDHFSIPTLCTLPQLVETEFMLHHAFNNLPSFEYFRNRVRKKDHISKILPFEFVLEEAFFKKNLNEYKWQCTGPVSMIETMEMHEHDEQMLSEYLNKIRLTQERFNQKTNAKSYLFLDEPMLGTAPGMETIFIQFLNKLKDQDCFKNTTFGIHSCSKLVFDLAKLPLDLISLDFSLYDLKEWEALQAQLGKRLVAITKNSNFESLDYPLKSETFQSTSCGQALCNVNLLKVF